jgi:hypothetical protein
MIRKLFIYLFISSFAFNRNAAEIDTITLTSNVMHKSIKSIIIIPNTFGLNKECYSLLYLLHGVGGDYTHWAPNDFQIQAYADAYNLMIVLTDRGFTS